MQNLINRMTYLFQGDFLSLTRECSVHYNLISGSCWWNIFNWKLPRVTIVFMKKVIGNDSVVDTLPWGGMVTVSLGGTADDVSRSAGSVICSDTSAGPACVWGADWGREGTSCVWGTGWTGEEGVARIGDAGRGREDGVVFCRFG